MPAELEPTQPVETPSLYFDLFHGKRVFLSSIVKHNYYVKAALAALMQDETLVGQRVLPFDGQEDILLQLKSNQNFEGIPIPWSDRRSIGRKDKPC